MISMNALAWTGVFIVIGVVLRAAVPFLRTIWFPQASLEVVIGFIVIQTGVIYNATVDDFSNIADFCGRSRLPTWALPWQRRKRPPTKKGL